MKLPTTPTVIERTDFVRYF
uniref:Uncharacterized protein n=1 Tax=Anguilla anguilla TaxID=7936 RepID=A0A0E9XAK0_ANGAN